MSYLDESREQVAREFQERVKLHNEMVVNAADQKRYQEERRRSWIQFWTATIINTALSIAAIIISIIALCS